MSNKFLPSGISVRIRENLIEGASRTQTTLIVDPIITLSGARVAMTDIGDKGYGKIDQGNAREELISWTSITDNTTTYTLTGVVWGVNFHNLTGGVTANMKRHNSGATFSINTDMHYIAEQFVSSDDFSVVDNSLEWGDGADTDKTIYAKNGDADKPFWRYVAALNKWLFSNDGVNTYDPTAGGSGVTGGVGININAGAVDIDRTDTSVYKSTSAGAADASKLPLTNASGVVDSSFIIDSAASTGLEAGANAGTKVKLNSLSGITLDTNGIGLTAESLYFGDSRDGSVTFDGSTTILGLVPSSSIYTLTRDIIGNVITINSGVTIKTGGYCMYAQSLINNGTIQNNGINGANGGNNTNAQTTGAIAPPAITVPASTAGGYGGGGASGLGQAGQAGGNGGNVTNIIIDAIHGGNGQAVSTSAGGSYGTYTYISGLITLIDLFNKFNFTGAIKLGTGGGGGAGGSSGSSAGGVYGGAGGAGGSAGGMVYVVAGIISGTGYINSIGGNGGAGGAGGDASHASGGQGGAGAGGIVLIITTTTVNPWTINVSGGTGYNNGVAGQTIYKVI